MPFDHQILYLNLVLLHGPSIAAGPSGIKTDLSSVLGLKTLSKLHHCFTTPHEFSDLKGFFVFQSSWRGVSIAAYDSIIATLFGKN